MIQKSNVGFNVARAIDISAFIEISKKLYISESFLSMCIEIMKKINLQ